MTIQRNYSCKRHQSSMNTNAACKIADTALTIEVDTTMVLC